MSTTNFNEDVVATCADIECRLPQSLAHYIIDKNELVQIDWKVQYANQQLVEVEKSISSNEFVWTNFTAEQIGQKCFELFTSINEVIKCAQIIQNDVYKSLSDWQRNQRMARSGDKDNLAKKMINKKLDLLEIQGYFGETYAIISKLRTTTNSLIKLLSLNQTEWSNAFKSIYVQLSDMLKDVITSSFVVEDQPPQIIKTTTKFAATVRLLLPKFNDKRFKPTIKVSILSEAQAKLQQENPATPLTESSSDLANNSGRLEQLVCSFTNLKLNTRPSRGDSVVTNDKYALLFQTKFQIGDLPTFHIWVMSFPVVVTVHGSQEAAASATIFWDNAFSEPNRTLFEVPDAVPWSRMALQLRFEFQFQTGCWLTDENINCLYEKAFGTATIHENREITRNQFSKSNLSPLKFTFWEWFFENMKLTRDFFSDAWKDNLIHGFISKSQAREKLLPNPPGTFLFLFSDSFLGGITAAYMHFSANSEPTVERLLPFCRTYFEGVTQPSTNIEKQTKSDRRPKSEKQTNETKINKSKIGDIIRNIKECVYLCPNADSNVLREKNEAFDKYYTKLGDKVNGYIVTRLQVVPSSSDNGTAETNIAGPSNAVTMAAVPSPPPQQQQAFSVAFDPSYFQSMDPSAIFPSQLSQEMNFNDYILQNCAAVSPQLSVTSSSSAYEKLVDDLMTISPLDNFYNDLSQIIQDESNDNTMDFDETFSYTEL